MKNKQMRITIDGPSNTGKTMLAWKIAEFLKLCGVSGDNITFFNDNAEQISDPAEIERRLNSALSRDMWQDTEFAIVERTPPKMSFWAAKPETYSPVLMSNDHINLEMGRKQRAAHDDVVIPTPDALKSAMDRLNLRPATKDAFIARLDAGAVALNSAANLLSHKPVLDMIADADGRKEGNEVRDEILDTFVGLGALRAIDAGPFTKVDPLMRFGGINRVMADPELKARVIAYFEQSNPFDLEGPINLEAGREWSSAEVMERHYGLGREVNVQSMTAEQVVAAGLSEDGVVRSESDLAAALTTMLFDPAAHAKLTAASRAAMSSHCGTVLGTPLGQNNGDHNGELETGYKYRHQIHPVTGETRDQMLMRAQPFVKTVQVREHVLLDYSGLPRDLVFDQQCGVRWYTEEELAKEGMRYPNALEFKHHGVRLMPNVTEPTTQPSVRILNPAPRDAYFSGIQDISMQAPREELSMKAEYTFPLYPQKTPRGMTRVFEAYDDAGLWPDGKVPPELEARRVERSNALDQKLSTAATNLSKIADVSSSGQVELPKADE